MLIEEPIYLNLNNTGGYSSDDPVKQYTKSKMLLDRFNIIIIHQVLRSPY